MTRYTIRAGIKPGARLLSSMLVGLLLAAGCSGCAYLEKLKPQNSSEAIAATYAAIESTADAVAAAHDLGHLSDADRAYAKETLQRAINITDEADRAIRADSSLDPSDYLGRAMNLVNSIKRLIEEREDGRSAARGTGEYGHAADLVAALDGGERRGAGSEVRTGQGRGPGAVAGGDRRVPGAGAGGRRPPLSLAA
ncbi:MAG: hypothetical protein ACU85V_00270 [Gammaproteobacteria bacterium]